MTIGESEKWVKAPATTTNDVQPVNVVFHETFYEDVMLLTNL